MLRATNKILTLVFLFFILFASPLYSSDWPSWHSSESGNGYTSHYPPAPLRSKFMYKADGEILSSPVVFNGVVYFGSRDCNLYAIDGSTGKMKWKYRTQGPIDSTPAISNGFVYFGSRDGYFYSLRISDGRLSFRFDAGASIVSSPLIIDGMVLFGTELSGEFISLNAQTGDIIYRLKLDGPIQSSPISYNGHIYISTNRGVFTVSMKRMEVSYSKR